MSGRRKLPITRAALLILQEEPGSAALHYRVITNRITERDMVASASRELERTVYSNLCTHIRSRGDQSWFLHAGPGIYGLTEAGRRARVWRSDSTTKDPSDGPTSVESAPRTDLTWQDAAESVLREAGKPLHSAEIVDRIWAAGLKARMDTRWPYRQMANQLACTIKEETKRGGTSRFARFGRSIYGLTAWRRSAQVQDAGDTADSLRSR